jgi:RNA polymerase sigma-70 factor (ECF subfamily)
MTALPDGQADKSMTELLLAVGRSQDIDAFEALFRHFAPRIKDYMSRGGGSASAEELMQETMVAVWKKAALYDASKGAASTWIFSIARNLRIDAYRRERRPEFDPNDPAFVPDGAPAADVVMVAFQDAGRVQRALLSLPADQATVLKMSFFEDQSQSAIAAALDLPLGTVKSRMRLAFDKLRTLIGGEAS